MTKEEALKYLENSMAIGQDDASRHHNEILEFIIKALKQETVCIAEIKISKEDMQELVNEKIKEITAGLEERKWIPCSERLPKESGFYLVSTTDCITIMEFINKEWISQNLGSCNWYVKAWQPLPGLYKPEKESEE